MSGATSRRKGNEWEAAVARWLRDQGVRAITSRDAHGGHQKGIDLICDLPVAVECKNVKQWDLAGWIDQAIDDAAPDPACVWIHRPRKASPGDGYVVMRGDQFLRLLRPDMEF